MEDNQVRNNNNLDSVEQEIFSAVDCAIKEYWYYYRAKDLENKRQNWLTHQIKGEVSKLGFAKNLGVSGYSGERQWLYDLVWYKNDATGELQEVPLVLESELSDRSEKGIRWDFQKLLVAHAQYRVFVCYHKGNGDFPNNVNSLLALFESMVDAYEALPAGARFLVLICDDFNAGDLYPHSIVKG